MAYESSLSPSYYKRGTAPVWDFIRDQGLNFHLGNAIKYICRYGHKGDYNAQLSDINKAIHYLQNELHHEKDLYFRASQGISYDIRDQEQSSEAYELVSEKSDC